jgi:hypothetical protein
MVKEATVSFPSTRRSTTRRSLPVDGEKSCSISSAMFLPERVRYLLSS